MSKKNPKTVMNGGVGYGRPPKQHQFKQGRSGNPKGRPKGSISEASLLREICEGRIETRSGGRTKKILILKGILLRITEDALKGNVKSAAFMLNRYGTKVTGEAPVEEVSDDEQEILEDYVKRINASQGKEET